MVYINVSVTGVPLKLTDFVHRSENIMFPFFLNQSAEKFLMRKGYFLKDGGQKVLYDQKTNLAVRTFLLENQMTVG